jgi:signal transduction histidine kinase
MPYNELEVSSVDHHPHVHINDRTPQGFADPEVLTGVIAHLPMAVWLLDRDGQVKLQNAAARRLWAGAEWVGPEDYHVYKARWADSGVPLKAEEWAAAKAVTANAPVVDQRVVITSFDGSEHSIINSAVPIANAAGRTLGFVVVNLDITDQECIRAELAAAKDQLSAILATIASAVILLDADSMVRVWNVGAERVLGVPAVAAIGRPFASLPIPWDWESLGALVPGFVTDRTVRLDEVRLEYPGKSDRIVAFTISPLAGTSTNDCLWLGADITERRGMEAHIRHAQKLESIGSLASGIAHEINTPMQFVSDNTRFLTEAFTGFISTITAMRGALDGLPEDRLASVRKAEKDSDLPYMVEEVPKALEQTQDGITRVTRIVKAMKDFAHPGVDELVPTDLNRAIDSTLTVSRNAWKYVADLDLQLDPELPPVPVVPGGFNQVVLNLVVNAAHAIEDAHRDGKGTISITTRRSGDGVIVEIADTGCGIPAELRHRIFDPFFTTKEPGRGTGQGLVIVRTEVEERLGGRIEIESEPGKGSVFRIRLPLLQSCTAIHRRRQSRGGGKP